MYLYPLKWFWRAFLRPPCFYKGGGGSSTVAQTNPEEQQLAQISDEKWASYKRRYIPIENEWMQQVQDLDSPLKHEQAQDMASNELKIQAGSSVPETGQALAAGKTPNSDDQSAVAGDLATAKNKTNLGVTDRYLKGLQNIVEIGQGQSGQAIQGLSDVANTSVQAQIQRNNNTFSQQQGAQSTNGAIAGGALAGGLAAATYRPSKRA